MSIFSAIMDKIFSHGGGVKPAAPAPVAQPLAPQGAAAPSQAAQPATASAQPTQTPAASVDVEAVLTQMASQKGGGGNWQTSIVDLLKLLNLDSSLDARKQLANELNVHVAGDGTPEENIALHKAVMRKLAENGGKVPDSLRG